MKVTRIIYFGLFSICIGNMGCNIDEKLKDSYVITPGGSTASASNLLIGTYNDLNATFHNQDQLFSLEENTSDECLVPTRGGDWDDNGVWRVLHAHAWDATHGQSSSVFTNMGKLESDATTVLAFNPTPEIAAEATFLRSLAQFYLLDLYGQVPYRTVANYNTVDASPVMTPEQAIDTLDANLTAIIPVLDAANKPYKASPDAARFLLMKVLLNKQAFLNRQTPAAADAADMQRVITLGQQIMSNGYSLSSNYFDNFSPTNATTGIGEMILAYPNTGKPDNGAGIASAGIDARWMMTLHYNSWDQQAGNAGWNGFATISDFYNSFDTSDSRRGNVAYPGITDVSGLKVGLLEGQQYDENGKMMQMRAGKGPLNFTPDVNLVEANPKTLEETGIRVIKYGPDYQAYNSGNQRNQLVFFRYADVILMVAEAQLQTGNAAGALINVNNLRSARKAPALTTLSLVNPDNLYDDNTLLSERQKELYWESWRRQDLIRFGVFLKPWALKDKDDPKYLLFPIPATQLIANPNLTQNPGY